MQFGLSLALFFFVCVGKGGDQQSQLKMSNKIIIIIKKSLEKSSRGERKILDLMNNIQRPRKLLFNLLRIYQTAEVCRL